MSLCHHYYLDQLLNRCAFSGPSQFDTRFTVPCDYNISVICKVYIFRNRITYNSTNICTYIQSNWHNYRTYKTEFGFEKYLVTLSYDLANVLCKFRCGSHRLPIECGRFFGIDRDERLCVL
jgi:hypothetical protein